MNANHQVAPCHPPIIKWAGGKEKELKYILPALPAYKRYFEPFVGGGSVFMALRADRYYINDLSDELIALYRNIAEGNRDFFAYCKDVDRSWTNVSRFFHSDGNLTDTFLNFRKGEMTGSQLADRLATFCKDKEGEIKGILAGEFRAMSAGTLLCEVRKNLCRKMLRMHELEIKKHPLTISDIEDNIETALKGALYMYYRSLYNDTRLRAGNQSLHNALFLFIRNFAYSGMFRYNDRGEFNVPYGGIGYNSKTLEKKLSYYHALADTDHFKNVTICNADFQDFLAGYVPEEDDFVFLDPPYDSEFSTYAGNTFTHDDHRRLAQWLLHECRAKWMLLIKHTDFIHGLYQADGVHIRTFEKEYMVSFMNRNDRHATHLLITNF